MDQRLELVATAGFGLEAVTARELKWLGYEDQMVENGRVVFRGDLSAIARSNLWLRTAERVLLRMGEFTATTFEELFQGTKNLPWEDWLPEDACFPVDGKSVDSTLFSVPDCQAIVKKAIVERLKSVYHKEWFDETGPRYRIEVALLKDRATLTIDTTGVGLHKRGYRTMVADAPLRETMASAMLLISHWKHDRALIDPFCGSGTIPLEAAQIALNLAPGRMRRFEAEQWDVFPKSIWKNARQEVADLALRERSIQIAGFDHDEKVLDLARFHAKQAGLDGRIHFQKQDARDLQSRLQYGCIVTNPPYGERIGEQAELERLMRSIGKRWEGNLPTWSYYILTSMPGFENFFGKQADKRRKLYNGRIQCQFYQYFGPRPPRKEPVSGNTEE